LKFLSGWDVSLIPAIFRVFDRAQWMVDLLEQFTRSFSEHEWSADQLDQVAYAFRPGDYALEVQPNYGGNFSILALNISNGFIPAGGVAEINVTVWNPYGWRSVSEINISIGDVFFFYNCVTNELQLLNGCDIIKEITNYWFDGYGGRGSLTIEFISLWGWSGIFNVTVSAEDSEHNLKVTRVFVNAAKVINQVYARLILKSEILAPCEPAWLYGEIYYVNSTIPADVQVIIEGVTIQTGSDGCFNYTFTSPSVPGTYNLTVDVEHGEKYIVGYRVSYKAGELYVTLMTKDGKNVILPQVLKYVLRNKTHIIAEVTSGSLATIPTIWGGEYLLQVSAFGIIVVNVSILLDSAEESIVLKVFDYYIDYRGAPIVYISNTSMTLSFDDANRKLNVISAYNSRFIVFYDLSYEPFINGTGYSLVCKNESLLVIDMSPNAFVSITYPRILTVQVVNPYGVTYPSRPEITLIANDKIIKLNESAPTEVPFVEEAKLKVIIGRIVHTRLVHLQADQRIQVEIPYLVVKDYRSLERSFLSNVSISVKTMTENFPYAITSILVNSSFKILITYGSPPDQVEVVSQNNISWLIDKETNAVIITGRVTYGSCEVIIKDLFILQVLAVDMLNRTVATHFDIIVNGSHFGSTCMLTPATYSLEVPEDISGFKFKRYQDGVLDRKRIITIVDRTTIVAIYLVPTRFENVTINTGDSTVEITGKLVDFFGSGVENAPILISITSSDGEEFSQTTTTMANGIFRYTTILMPGNYKIKLDFNGTTIYDKCHAEYQIQIQQKQAPLPSYSMIVLVIAITAFITSIVNIGLQILARKKRKHQ